MPPLLNAKKIIIYLLFFFVCINSFSADFKGKVTDVTSKEPLFGASIVLKGNGKILKTASTLDGTFIFKNLQLGKYQLNIQFIGYETFIDNNVIVKEDNKTQVLSFSLITSKLSLNGVTVTASKGRETDEYARRTEKNADNVLNIVSAKSIELSPDITVGNVLQRVSGVSVQRSGNGDGQYAIIRGMDKRYSYTSVNGVILPSPDDKNRSVPMDMFPAEMIERLEVVKALTPNLDADAIGGATNLVMKNAPNNLTVSANFSAGTNNLFQSRPFTGFDASGINSKSPSELYGTSYVSKVTDFTVSQLNFHKVANPVNTIASLSIGNRIFNKKLGFLIAGSYSNQFRGSNTTFYQANGQPGVDPIANTPIFLYVRNREYSSEQTRTGLHTKLDYEFSAKHKINIYALYLQLDDKQLRHEIVTGLGGTGEIDYHDRVVFQRKNLSNLTLSGTDIFTNNFNADWSITYSAASSKTPDWVDLVYFKENLNSNSLYASPLDHTWTHNNDVDKSAYLNFTYNPTNIIEIKAGGLYRSKDRVNYFNDYTLSTVIPGQTRQPYTDVNNLIFSFRPASYAYADSTNPLNYNGQEEVTAGYIQSKINFNDKLQLVGGFRSEITHQHYYSELSKTLPGKTGTIDYMDILPSLHLRYKLAENKNLRASYFAGISRPNIFELIPAPINGDFFTESGNYNLKHTTSDNFDIRWEDFFNSTDHFLIGGFYKHIINPIEYAFVNKGGSNFLYEPTNPQANALNYGFELVFSKYIKNWGITGNYSYTHSEVTTPKAVYGRISYPSGQISPIDYINETRPLQGQADHIGNLSLLYKSPTKGLDAQLSFVYTGRRISVVSQYLGLDYWQRATTQLDFSTEKKIKKHIALFAKATNLLNNHLYQEILHANNLLGLQEQTNANRILVQKDVFNQSFLIGFKYKL